MLIPYFPSPKGKDTTQETPVSKVCATGGLCRCSLVSSCILHISRYLKSCYTELLPPSETAHCHHTHSQQGALPVAKSMRYLSPTKGFFWERQVRSVQATFVFFTSLRNEDDVKELTSSLLLFRLMGQRETRLSLRN